MPTDRGAAIYQQKCAECHGADGEGTELDYPHPLQGDKTVEGLTRFIDEEMPPGFQTAEFLLEHGFVDAVVPRPELRSSLARLLRLLPVPAASDADPLADRARGPIGTLSGLAQRVGGAVSDTIGIEVDPEAVKRE